MAHSAGSPSQSALQPRPMTELARLPLERSAGGARRGREPLRGRAGTAAQNPRARGPPRAGGPAALAPRAMVRPGRRWTPPESRPGGAPQRTLLLEPPLHPPPCARRLRARSHDPEAGEGPATWPARVRSLGGRAWSSRRSRRWRSRPPHGWQRPGSGRASGRSGRRARGYRPRRAGDSSRAALRPG